MKNLLNLALILGLLVVLGCKCQTMMDEINNAANTPSPIPTASPSESPTKTDKESNSDSKSDNTKKDDSKSDSDSSSSSGVTKASFEKIKVGMTLDEINKIIGKDGEEIYSSTVSGKKYAAYKWEGSNYATITGSFADNKLTSKYEANLK